MKRGVIGVLFACIFAFALHSYHKPVLSHLLKHDVATWITLPAAKSFHVNAYHQYHRFHSPTGSQYWLNSSTYLANHDADIAFELYVLFKNLKRSSQQQLWLEKASDMQHLDATYLYIKQLIKRKKFTEALYLLNENFLAHHAKTYHLLIELSLLKGDKETYQWAYEKLNTLAPNSTLLNHLSKINLFNKPSTTKLNCDISFLPVATTLPNILRLERLLQQTKKSRFAEYVCFNAITYMPLEQLNCQHQMNARIDCSVEPLKARLNDGSSRYLLVMLPNGGANVNNGVLYIDQNDSIDVFYHELAHILGFIDEYPLPSNHAKCSAEQAPFSHNVAVLDVGLLKTLNKDHLRMRILANVPWRDKILPSTPVYSETPNGINIGTPQEYHEAIGLFITNTCNKQSKQKALQAFKPISFRSKMEYFELTFPEVYWQFLSDNKSAFVMPAFFKGDKITAP